MVTFRFLSYIKTITGVSKFDLNGEFKTVIEALEAIVRIFPELGELILDDVPEVSFIMGNRSLLVPIDLKLPLTGEIIIGPIVAGGSLILS